MIFIALIRDGNESIAHVALRRLGDDLEIRRTDLVPERHRAALAFSTRHGYTAIDVCPPYKRLACSQCLEKALG